MRYRPCAFEPSRTSVSKNFQIPKFYYIESGNDYSGSRGDIAFKIKYGDKLKAMIWRGYLCSDKADIEFEAEFDNSQEGFDELVKWLDDRYTDYKKQ